MSSYPTRNTVQVPANLKAFKGANYRKNQEAARHNGHYVDETCCCVLCGKKAIGGGTFVLLTNVGEYTTKEEMAEHEKLVEARGGSPDDLGLYPVGFDCAKKLKAAGVTIYNAEIEAV